MPSRTLAVEPRSSGGVSTEIGSPPHCIRQASATMNDRPESHKNLRQFRPYQAAQDEALDHRAEQRNAQACQQCGDPETEAPGDAGSRRNTRRA